MDTEFSQAAPSAWTHLIKKIYEVVPLICAHCRPTRVPVCRRGGLSLKTAPECANLSRSRDFFTTGGYKTACADKMDYVKQAMTGLLVQLMASSTALAESKFLSLSLFNSHL